MSGHDDRKKSQGPSPERPGPERPGVQGTENCRRWEAAVADLMDGALTAEAEAQLRAHASGCPECAGLLKEASNGRDWVRMLHAAPPPVPEALLGRILAQTSERPQGAGSGFSTDGAYAEAVAVMPMPSGPAMVLPGVWMLRGQHQARLLMTAAMAVFSIALTLSMTGIRVSNLHAAVAAPGQLQASAARQFFDTKKQVVSFYDNLRVVREMEANVHDAWHDLSAQNTSQPGSAQGGAHTKSGADRAQPSARRNTAPSANGTYFHAPRSVLVSNPQSPQAHSETAAI